jgi:alpha-glucoside transport system substrate-binding protein
VPPPPTNWSEAGPIFGNVDGTQYGVPVKTDLKSLVWYQPARFEAAGYEVPETFDEFTALVDQMDRRRRKPLCVGIESGQATGWTYTDWVEDMVLRQHGPDVYDQWVSNEIPFNDPQIVESMQTVLDLWSEDNVFASGGSIAATAFQDNGSRSSTALLHAPSGVVLRGLLPGGHRVRRRLRRRGRRLLLPGHQR